MGFIEAVHYLKQRINLQKVLSNKINDDQKQVAVSSGV